MLVPVADLVGRPGSTRQLHRVIAVGDLGDDSLGDNTWGPADGLLRGDLDLDLGLDSVVEGIWVHGQMTWQLEVECSRCLGPVELDRSSEVGELFIDASRGMGNEPVEDGYGILDDGSSIDLERMVHDVVVLDLPTAVRCDRADCAPPALEGVTVMTEDELAAVASDEPDPRWAALASLDLGDS